MITASGLEVYDNEGPGLYAVEGALACTGCTLRNNEFAGAAVLSNGRLEIHDSWIEGTLENGNIGGGVGIYAAQQIRYDPAILHIADSVVTDNRVAGIWMGGAGAYRVSDTVIAATQGLPHGSTTRCGDGVYARNTAAWDGSSGVDLSGNTLSDNEGAGVFLDDATATFTGTTWQYNEPDLRIQGEACSEAWDALDGEPAVEACPEWHEPSCDMEFALNLALNLPQLPPPPVRSNPRRRAGPVWNPE